MPVDVREICDRFNQLAPSLAPRLLPNGRKAGNKWMFSGIEDHGRSESAWVNLSGPLIGHWQDAGNARAGEEKGDLLDLVQHKVTFGDKAAAVEYAKRELGLEDSFTPGKRPVQTAEERERAAAEARERQLEQAKTFEAERSKKAKDAKRLFLSAGQLGGSPAEFYLAGRAIGNPPGARWPGSLRYHPEAWCTPLQRKQPAMVGGIFDAAGRQVGAHRTYLQLDGKRGWTKIDHPNAKMVLGNLKGGFVPIHQGKSGKSMRQMLESEPVYVTEGIEDALCVRMLLPDRRIVCAITLGNIGAIILPAAARKLVLVCDRDTNETAQETLERSIAAQQARGLTVDLVMPPAGIKDINDWIRADPERGAA